jgi:hypothetical protein
MSREKITFGGLSAKIPLLPCKVSGIGLTTGARYLSIVMLLTPMLMPAVPIPISGTPADA